MWRLLAWSEGGGAQPPRGGGGGGGVRDEAITGSASACRLDGKGYYVFNQRCIILSIICG